MTRERAIARWALASLVGLSLSASGCVTFGKKTSEIAAQGALQGTKAEAQQAQAAGQEPAAARAGRDIVEGTLDELTRPEQVRRMRALINAAVAEALMTAMRPAPTSAVPPASAQGVGGANTAGAQAGDPPVSAQSLAQLLAAQVAPVAATHAGAAMFPECAGMDASQCLEKLGHATSKGIVAGALESFGGYLLAFLGGALVATLLIVAGLGATRFGRELRERRHAGGARR